MFEDLPEAIIVNAKVEDLPPFWKPEPGQKPDKSKQNHHHNEPRSNQQERFTGNDKPGKIECPVEENTIYKNTRRLWACGFCRSKEEFVLTDLEFSGGMFIRSKLLCLECGTESVEKVYTPIVAFTDGQIVKV